MSEEGQSINQDKIAHYTNSETTRSRLELSVNSFVFRYLDLGYRSIENITPQRLGHSVKNARHNLKKIGISFETQK